MFGNRVGSAEISAVSI